MTETQNKELAKALADVIEILQPFESGEQKRLIGAIAIILGVHIIDWKPREKS